jgi:PAS domain S-box-containing protein
MLSSYGIAVVGVILAAVTMVGVFLYRTRKAAKGLEDRDEHCRAFIANSSEGIWLFEFRTPIPETLPDDEQLDRIFQLAYLADCNDAIARMYGYENARQILNAPLRNLTKSPNPQSRAIFAALRRTGRLSNLETRELDKNGNTKYFIKNVTLVKEHGAFVRCWGTQRDVTLQKQVKERLRESEARFEKAFEISPDPLVISRIDDGTILEVNDSFASLTGYTHNELIGKSTLSLNLYADPADRARALAIMMEQDRLRDFEFPIRLKSGELRLYSMSAEVFELRGEHCWLTIGRDITDRKRAESDRERLLKTEKLAREEAEAAGRFKDEFLAMISHELRTPLTSILGWAKMLNRGALPESQTRHAFQVIEQNAKFQAQLVDDLLDTSRIMTGSLKIDAHPVDIERILQNAIEVIRPSAKAKRIAVQIFINQRGGVVLGDANRLQQAIWNLLANAVKFTNEDGRVEVRLGQTSGSIELSVTDTGIGIEPEFVPCIFDRFRQADSTSTRRYGGLGLGLSIVRNVIEMHGGSVSVSSPGKGRGSTFKIVLPEDLQKFKQTQNEAVKPESKQGDERKGQEAGLNLKGVRVLVVEDDPDTLELLRFILDRRGAEVNTAASTREALDVMEHWQPTTLVSDLAMPDQDGYELIGRIRSRSSDRGGNIPAVAVSAYTRTEDRIRALSAGFQMHLPKPVDPEELVATVASLAGLGHS